MTEQLRVRAYSVLQKDRGYTEPERVYYQVLEKKTRFGWKQIDCEIVPVHVIISIGCLGDAGGWKSKFAEYGPFGRDGIIHER